MALLLDALRQAGAHEQADALASRAAAHAPLDNPGDVAELLDILRRAGAHEQAAALLARDPAAHANLDNPSGVASLLDSPHLRRMGAHEQAAALLARDPAAHANLDDPGAVAYLLDACGRRARTSRPPSCWPAIPPPTPTSTTRIGVASLLDSLRRAGAHEQADALASRAAAHTAFGDPDAVAYLLDVLRAAGAHEQAATLVSRLPAVGMFGLYLEQEGAADQFRFGREADGTPAAPWRWEDLDLWLVARLRVPSRSTAEIAT